MRRPVIYAGFWRSTEVRKRVKIINDFVLTSKCLECDGSGIFGCGIPEEKGICVRCKGTGIEYFGTI